MDRRPRAAALFARRISADRRSWRDTAVQMPDGFSEGRDLFTGETFAAADGKLPLAGAFACLPSQL